MRTLLTAACALVAFVTASSLADDRGRIDLGIPVISKPIAPAPVLPPVPVPVPESPQVILYEAPRFIYSPILGFYVSVGIQYDIVYIAPNYYYYWRGNWYKGPYYNGPWQVTTPQMLPRIMVKFNYERIRLYRDQEYKKYLQDRMYYRGQWHDPMLR
ncbi:MAG: hypothetical protein A2X79_03885 [Desulfuromonadaceae bacterium GWB2_53_15]|nr:MAG: hypothetical protein A2X83_04535 [Desulfuromonadales bacterium GWD2_54_10]OHB30829.1 MAG: hypothetical protein A2X79_03885 [Desulfuromonadaceae bacterium GWB2_53_15]